MVMTSLPARLYRQLSDARLEHLVWPMHKESNPLPKPIKDRREERELFFWTARQTLRLVVFTALTVYLVLSLLKGQLPGSELLLRLL